MLQAIKNPAFARLDFEASILFKGLDLDSLQVS